MNASLHGVHKASIGAKHRAGIIVAVGIIIDVTARTVTQDGATTELSEREVAVLAVLGSGSVVSRAELIRDAGLGELSSRRCESLIMALRQVLGTDTIINLRRRGWRLATEAEVRT